MELQKQARLDSDIMARSAPGGHMYFLGWTVICLFSGFFVDQPMWSWSLFSVFLFFTISRFFFHYYYKRIYAFSRNLWLGLIYFHTCIPAFILSSVFAASFVLEALIPINVYLLMIVFAFISGGVVSFAPNLKLSISYMVALIIPIIGVTVFDSMHGSLTGYLAMVYASYTLFIAIRINKEYMIAINNEFELRANQEVLKAQGDTDALTHIKNRGFFDRTLHQEWERSIRNNHPLTLMLLDLDYFKSVNDTYGHPIGDIVLRDIAAIISQQCSRPSDLVARYGGEEFAILMVESDHSGAETVANKILSAVQDYQLNLEDATIKTTISIGVVTLQPNHEITIEQLVKAADTALYQAKEKGRNRVEYAPALTPSIHQRAN